MIAHELGHVRSRHILKAIGWTALLVLPTLWLLALATPPARAGSAEPENLPYAFLVLTRARAPDDAGRERRSHGATRPRRTGAR